jgi:hypothetical protein
MVEDQGVSKSRCLLIWFDNSTIHGAELVGFGDGAPYKPILR